MNEFRTIVSVKAAKEPINLKNKVLTVGSCFADAIGARLDLNKFPSMVNPFGVIYNPLSIHKAVRYAALNEIPAAHTYLRHGELFLNYDLHSSLASLQKDDLINTIQNRIGSVHYFLKDAHRLFLTYGTAWVYTRNDTGEVVANCHKMPPTTFSKALLTPEEIGMSFEELYQVLVGINPGVRIILTVSPVRHVRDTLELNSLSKSILRLACHQITQKFEAVEYFPAYEMMLDDLRDYRFYKSDMLHPTELAEDYIWGKFADRYFTPDTKQFMKEWEAILQALSHRPFHPGSEGHQQFLRTTLRRLEELKNRIDVSKEIASVRQQLQ